MRSILIHKEVINDQLRVHHNGQLIYERQLRVSRSVVIEQYGSPTWNHERDQGNKVGYTVPKIGEPVQVKINTPKSLEFKEG